MVLEVSIWGICVTPGMKERTTNNFTHILFRIQPPSVFSQFMNTNFATY